MRDMVIGTKEETFVSEIRGFRSKSLEALRIIMDFESMVNTTAKPTRKLKKIFSRVEALYDLISSFEIELEIDADHPGSFPLKYIVLDWQDKKYSTRDEDSHLSKRGIVAYTLEFSNLVDKEVDAIFAENPYTIEAITKIRTKLDEIVNTYLN